jgi:homoserine kinase
MIKVKVPATTANLGPGFDTLGLALNLYNYFEVKFCDGETVINGEREVDGFFRKIIKLTSEYFNIPLKEYSINISANIPISRGLGSSASCIVGVSYSILHLNEIKFTKQQLVDLCSNIEGHPDNVTPAIVGGMTIGYKKDKYNYSSIIYKKIPKIYALIPNYQTSTLEAREILPKNVTLKDAVYNISSIALLINGFYTGNYDLISLGLDDKLHQPFRKQLISGYDFHDELFPKELLIGKFISGAGPTVIYLLKEDIHIVESSMYKILKLEVDTSGVQKI